MSQDENKNRRIGFSVNQETFDRLEAFSKQNELKYTTLFEALIWGADDAHIKEALTKVPSHLKVNKQTLMSDLMKLPAEKLAELLAQANKGMDHS